MKKISLISSNYVSVRTFLIKSIHKISKNNQIIIFTSLKDYDGFFDKNKNIKLIDVKIQREINLFKDILSLVIILLNLIKYKPDLVLTITPKGGFLGILSAFLVRSNTRIHYFTGQVWVTKKGIVKYMLKSFDKLIYKLSTHCLTDSELQKKFLEDSGVVKKDDIKVLGNGSICGVDTKKFYPNQDYRTHVRNELNISPNTILLLFLGRLNTDKGILDLAHVFNEIFKNQNKNISLLIVGPDEENIKSKIKMSCKESIDKIHFVDFTNQPEKYMAAADIFCLPSYREGFGMAALEAGACALPVITSRIYGLVDAVKENQTGLFHEVKNKKQLGECIITLVENKVLREKLGRQGRERVLKEFEQDYVTNEFVRYVQSLVDIENHITIISSNQLSIELFLNRQIEKLSKLSHVNLVTNIDNNDFTKRINKQYNNIKLFHINIRRRVSIFWDIHSFFKLFFLFIFLKKTDFVFTITPKGGFLGILIGYIFRIKNRVHWYGGQVWFNRKGVVKFILKNIDKFIYRLSTEVLTECNSQKNFLEDSGVVKKDDIKVLGNGSICGVDTKKFYPNQDYRTHVRNELNISPNTILLLFLGRLNTDKGILDLAHVFNEIFKNQNKNISLLIVGPDEENIKSKIKMSCKESIDKIHFVDFTNQPEKYMAAADIFCLPSYREGFGMAALEAGACALPVITSRIYGLVDAVKENQTGLFHEVKNKKQLGECIITLVENKVLREKLGRQGRERVLKEFEQDYVTNEFVRYVQSL